VTSLAPQEEEHHHNTAQLYCYSTIFPYCQARPGTLKRMRNQIIRLSVETFVITHIFNVYLVNFFHGNNQNLNKLSMRRKFPHDSVSDFLYFHVVQVQEQQPSKHRYIIVAMQLSHFSRSMTINCKQRWRRPAFRVHLLRYCVRQTIVRNGQLHLCRHVSRAANIVVRIGFAFPFRGREEAERHNTTKPNKRNTLKEVRQNCQHKSLAQL
jgi:hypothetical protein